MLTRLNKAKTGPIIIITLLFCLLTSTYSQSSLESIEQFRQEYIQAFLEDEYAPLDSNSISYLRFFPADTSYITLASFERTPEAIPFDMPTSSGMVKPYVCYGKIRFQLNDTILNALVYQSLRLAETEEYENYLLFPFNDFTNNLTSYGGGRYIDLSIEDIKNGTIIIDFNRAYNPYCAYSDGYNCPVPPSENYLPTYIEAGEKMYEGPRLERTH